MDDRQFGEPLGIVCIGQPSFIMPQAWEKKRTLLNIRNCVHLAEAELQGHRVTTGNFTNYA